MPEIVSIIMLKYIYLALGPKYRYTKDISFINSTILLLCFPLYTLFHQLSFGGSSSKIPVRMAINL